MRNLHRQSMNRIEIFCWERVDDTLSLCDFAPYEYDFWLRLARIFMVYNIDLWNADPTKI